jgi:hypothetical protein
MTSRLDQLDPVDALYTVAKKYPGGIDALAKRMELNAFTLYKKLERNNSTHNLQFAEFIEIVSCCAAAGVPDAYRPLRALNWQLDHVAVHVPMLASASDSDLSRDMVKAVAEAGDVARKLDEFLSDDGLIDAKEGRELDVEIEQAIAAMVTLRDRARKLRGKGRRG